MARVLFKFRYRESKPEQVIEQYWPWICKKIAENTSASAAGWLARAQRQVEKSELSILFANPMMKEVASKKKLDQVIEELISEVSGQHLTVRLESKHSEMAQEEFREQQAEEQKALVAEALVAQQETKSPSRPEIEAPLTLGYNFHDEPIPIKEIEDEERRVCIQGTVFKAEIRQLRSGRTLLTFNLTDYTDSIAAKIFARDKEDAAMLERIKNGIWVRVRGSVQFDTFARDLVLMVNDLQEVQVPKKMDTAEEKRVELHLHTAMSAMDGVASPGKW